MPQDATPIPPDAALPSIVGPPALRDLFLSFAKLGVTSFGGGLAGWMMQECVRRRRWVTEDEFLTGLAMAQALPGVNVVNLPLWIGYRLAGNTGALVAASGVIVPPMIIVMIMAAAYGFLARFGATHLALQGAAAAAIGLSLSMGLRAARRQIRRLAPALVLVLVFAGVGVLKLPMLLIVGVMAPVSIALAYRELAAHA
jgi:chromate transporter